jgi:hypothetical protein
MTRDDSMRLLNEWAKCSKEHVHEWTVFNATSLVEALNTVRGPERFPMTHENLLAAIQCMEQDELLDVIQRQVRFDLKRIKPCTMPERYGVTHMVTDVTKP